MSKLCNHIIILILIIYSHNLYSQHHFTVTNKQTNFVITYNNVPDSVKSCVQFVTNQLQQYIFTPIPINVSVTWTELSSTVQAYAKPSAMIRNIDGLPYKDVLYPIVLAEKIVSKNLNFNNPDIELVINSKNAWQANYIQDIDANLYDLATVLLHEFIHGLGMSGNYAKENTIPTLLGYPTIFDTFITYKNKFDITNLYTHGLLSKDSLAQILTSDSLFWSGAYTNAFFGFSPELYAPHQFDYGSSIYHFDEQLFPKGNANSLMTYVILKGERIHTLGVVVQGLLADIGWTDYYISAIEKQNTVQVTNSHEFIVSCIDSLFIPNSQTLMYSYDAGKNFLELPMNYNVVQESYTIDLPAFPFEHTCWYAYRIVTNENDTLYYPSDFPHRLFSFYVGADTVAPEIQHTQLTSILLEEHAIDFTASVVDNFTIDSVYVEYIIGRNDFAQIIAMGKQTMQLGDFGLCTTELTVNNLQLKENDMIAYTIVAVDSYSNISYVVPKGAYIFAVFEPKQEPLHFFITDFEHDSIIPYFYFDKFSIAKPTGFSNKALHTEHPYKTSDKDLTYRQYIAELKNPIIIASNPAYIEFDEIVLVEPSLTSVVFGEYGFWDYVIVEAIKNKKTDEWQALGKVGYDSRQYSEWVSSFYQSLDNEKNSATVPQESLYKKRRINLLENKYFRTGDTVSIRFRLQSDFIVYGWGWCIDNLKIQERIAQTHIPLRTDMFTLYPNPCNNTVSIANYNQELEIQCFNLYGVRQNVYCEYGNLDVSSISSGMYIVYITDITGKKYSQLLVKE